MESHDNMADAIQDSMSETAYWIEKQRQQDRRQFKQFYDACDTIKHAGKTLVVVTYQRVSWEKAIQIRESGVYKLHKYTAVWCSQRKGWYLAKFWHESAKYRFMSGRDTPTVFMKDTSVYSDTSISEAEMNDMFIVNERECRQNGLDRSYGEYLLDDADTDDVIEAMEHAGKDTSELERDDDEFEIAIERIMRNKRIRWSRIERLIRSREKGSYPLP